MTVALSSSLTMRGVGVALRSCALFFILLYLKPPSDFGMFREFI